MGRKAWKGHARGLSGHNRNPAMLEALRRLLGNEAGATAVEYGLLAALVSAAGIAALSLLGVSLETLINLVAGYVDDAHRCAQVGSNCGK